MNFDPRTAFFIVGMLYLVTPLITWGVVPDKRASPTIWWCVGGFLNGIGTLWVSLAIGFFPWMVFQVVGSLLLLSGMLLKMRTLRFLLDKPHPHGFISAFFVLYFLAEGALFSLLGESVLRVAVIISHALIHGYLAWLAWFLYTARKQAASLWIFLSYAPIPLLLLVSLIQQPSANSVVLLTGPLVLLIAVFGASTSIMNHIGYVGLLLQNSRQDALSALAEVARQSERQAFTENVLVSQRERLLANISRKLVHELSQPLTSLLSTVRLLRRADADGRLKELDMGGLIGRLDSSAELAAQIVDQIRPMAKRHADAKAKVNLQELIEQALDLLKVSQESTRFRFSTVHNASSLWVNVNQVELIQVLINLLSNALQAADMAGRTPDVVISLYAEDNEAYCVIEDNGMGFSAAALAKIGQSIFSTKSDGMGVGLWLCEEIMQRHEGSLVCTNYDGGARVEVRLPLAQVPNHVQSRGPHG